MRTRWLAGAGLAVVMGAAVAGCGGGGDEADATAVTGSGGNVGSASTTVKAELKDLSISVDKTSAPSGQVTFETANKGAIPHELVVIQTDLPAESLQLSDGKVDEKKLKVAGEIEEYQANKTEKGTFGLAPGKYVLICNVPGHYQGGMRLGFTVQ